MEVIVRQGDREERVRVRRADSAHGYEVTVGHHTYQVDAAAAGGLLSLRIKGRQHEVSVRPEGEGVYRVTTAAGAVAVEVADPLTHLARQGLAGKAAKRRQRVTAYMPGRVVAVLVQEGAEVKTGQGIVVLEAMKMQNEIPAEHDGIVSKILVQPGQAVEGGDGLFEME
ncbi:MAG TPA: biotin/lipoyl-containing protein [Thermoanaerobaculia bacterium]|nr:biotin/lipoyl-containing protein [Thermoanaerobaculia bacterium]